MKKIINNKLNLNYYVDLNYSNLENLIRYTIEI